MLQVHPWDGAKAAPRAQSFGYEQEVAIHSDLSNLRCVLTMLALPGLCHGPDLVFWRCLASPGLEIANLHVKERVGVMQGVAAVSMETPISPHHEKKGPG